MAATYTPLTSARMLQLLEQAGVTKQEFRTQYWKKGTNLTLSAFDRVSNISIKKLVKLCEILKLSPNEILQYSDNNNNPPNIIGGVNIVNSPNSNIQLEQLKTELEAARKLISVYEKDIAAKNRQIDDLISLCQSVHHAKPAQNSDENNS